MIVCLTVPNNVVMASAFATKILTNRNVSVMITIMVTNARIVEALWVVGASTKGAFVLLLTK